MSLTLQPYDRAGAVAYAHHWAYGRNPRFYDYERLGGDCTNFASQCLYAGGGVMNFVRDFGWYYVDPNQKAPAWTGVEYLFQFLTREQPSAGPAAVEGGPEDMMPGDIIQLSFDGQRFAHSPVVVGGGRNVQTGRSSSWLPPTAMTVTTGRFTPIPFKKRAIST